MALFLAGLLASLSVVSSYAAVPESGAAQSTRRFLAGAAASNISPRLSVSINGYFSDRPAAHIHDELHARCLVLDNGETRLAVVVCDSCMIPREVTDAAKALIQQRSGLTPDHVLISATHTHTAPTCAGVFQSEPDPEYARFLTARIADAVARAINNLAPARIAWGKGQEPNQVFNRRWKMKPGAIPPNPFGGTNDLVRMNPPIESPDLVEPAGPTDPEIAVLSIQTVEGRPLALLANYSLHYVGTTKSSDISADYFGVFADRIQQLLGADRLDPPFVALLANGASGDINNINFRQKRPPSGPYDQMRTVADAVAAEVHRVCKTLEYRDWVRLATRQTELSLAVRKPAQSEVTKAQALLAGANQPLQTPQEIYARETLLLGDFPDRVPLSLQVLRIGDLGLAAIPCEVFAEIGLEIKARSPLPQTCIIELANGYNGYLPTPGQHRLGGYETWRARSSYLETEASPKIVSALLGLFQQVAD